MTGNIAIVSATDEAYLVLFEDMIRSLGDKLSAFGLVVMDLGLTDRGKDRIRSIKSDVYFLKPDWSRDFRGRDKIPEYNKVFLSKPFIPDMFTGYEGYVWVDADVWFQDVNAIQGYIEAGRTTGASFAFESHPSYQGTQKIRKLEMFGKVIIKGNKNYFMSKSVKMFGARIASECGMQYALNSGVFYIASGSPVWRAWQEATLDAKIDRRWRSLQLCDQTCLQVSLLQNGLPYAIMPATYNWIPNFSSPLIDKEEYELVDPVYPNRPLKVIHLVGPKKRKYDLQCTDGRRVETTLDWTTYQKWKLENVSQLQAFG